MPVPLLLLLFHQLPTWLPSCAPPSAPMIGLPCWLVLPVVVRLTRDLLSHNMSLARCTIRNGSLTALTGELGRRPDTKHSSLA